jgi:hypothetical protein
MSGDSIRGELRRLSALDLAESMDPAEAVDLLEKECWDFVCRNTTDAGIAEDKIRTVAAMYRGALSIARLELAKTE